MRENAFLRVNELAQLLELSPETVKEQIDRGELPAVRAGLRVRILQSDLDRLIAQRAPAGPPANQAPAFSSDSAPVVAPAPPGAREPPRASGGLEPQPPGGDQWGRLDTALNDSRAALASADSVQLVHALRELATAANRLADTLVLSAQERRD